MFAQIQGEGTKTPHLSGKNVRLIFGRAHEMRYILVWLSLENTIYHGKQINFSVRKLCKISGFIKHICMRR